MTSVAQINLSHLRHNVSSIRNHIGARTFLCPMIKANAYGHGVVEVCKELESEDIQAFGVVTLNEGIEIREAVNPKRPVLVFSNFSKKDLESCVDFRLTPVIADWETLRALVEVTEKNPLNVHLKFNSGMNRQGFEISEAIKVKGIVDGNNIPINGIATHLAKGEDISDKNGFSLEQIEKFKKLIPVFGKGQNYHLYNSASLLQIDRFDYGARPGISIYGVDPGHQGGTKVSLRPVMRLKSPITLIREIKAGEIVSYGGTWKASQRSKIGVIPIGYADGLRRGLSNKLRFTLGDQRVPQVGTICMDYCMIDITGVEDVHVGQTVTIFGWEDSEMRVSAVAKEIDTISYEILTGIGQRVRREYLHAED